MQRIKNALRRDFGVLLLDVVAVNLAYFLALAFRVAVNNMGGIFGSPSDVPVYFSAFYRIAPIYTVLCVIVFFVFRLYGGVWRFAGINDMYRILASWVVTTLIQIVVSYLMMKSIGFSTSRMPATYYMLGCMLQLLFVTAIRFVPKTIADEKRRRMKKAEKALVVGAGELGQQTIKLLQSGTEYDVCCVVDTEQEHVGLLLDGIPVFGLETFSALLEKNEIRCVFLAEPHLNATDRRMIASICKEKNIDLRERLFSSRSDRENIGKTVTEAEFVPVTLVDEKWADEYKKEFGEEPSFF